ncbi:Spy/CpxP family protein refolding chaperone [Niveibacterium sp. SC-1]|uniref:Spy/CpxP family protein refolding chaperone n=1 Tax=Niveibacterium sp. SC-1 TaxID=3135646 RepID=UPI003120326B
MKQFNARLSRLFAIAALSALPALVMAAPDGGPGRGPGPDAPRMGGFEHGGMRGHMRLPRDLTEAQRDKIFAIHHAQEPALREAGKQVFKTRQALRELATADNYDAARARSLADDLGRAEAEQARLHADTMAQVWKVLTPEQRKQMNERPEGRGPMPPKAG